MTYDTEALRRAMRPRPERAHEPIAPREMLWALRAVLGPGAPEPSPRRCFRLATLVGVARRGRRVDLEDALRGLLFELEHQLGESAGAPSIAGLDDVEQDLLSLLSLPMLGWLVRDEEQRDTAADPVGDGTLTAIARALDTSVDRVREALDDGSPLRSARLVELAGGVPRTTELGELVCDPRARAELDELLVLGDEPAFELADFPHLRRDLELLRMHLAACLDDERATAVLIRGPHESGRTQIARALARARGGRLLEQRRAADLDGDDTLRLAQLIAGATPRSIVLVEDRPAVPRLRRRRRPSEEETEPSQASFRVPTLFIQSEETERRPLWMELDEPAAPLRFDFVLDVPAAPLTMRRAAAARALAPFDFADGDVERIARRASSGGAVERAAEFVRNLGALERDAAVDGILHLVDAEARRSGEVPLPEPTSPLPYDPGWLNASVSPTILLERLVARPRGTLLLHGVPGTGKSALAREIARRAGLPVAAYSGADLLSKWLGGTEKRLAEAFARARAEGALLLLDEVDAFLQRRDRAERSWEVTQVDELLLQLERFDGLLVASTNLIDHLDRAALRRFDVKVEMRPPRPEQRRDLLRAALEQLDLYAASDLVETLAADLEGLTVGDVAAVLRRCRTLLDVESAKELGEALRGELDCRGPRARRIGY